MAELKLKQEEEARLKDQEEEEEPDSNRKKKAKKQKGKKVKKVAEEEKEEIEEYPIINLDYACIRTNSLPTLSDFNDIQRYLKEKSTKVLIIDDDNADTTFDTLNVHIAVISCLFG